MPTSNQRIVNGRPVGGTCLNCGLKKVPKITLATCDLRFVDCNTSIVHECAGCPKFLSWFNGPDNPDIQSWYSQTLLSLVVSASHLLAATIGKSLLASDNPRCPNNSKY